MKTFFNYVFSFSFLCWRALRIKMSFHEGARLARARTRFLIETNYSRRLVFDASTRTLDCLCFCFFLTLMIMMKSRVIIEIFRNLRNLPPHENVSRVYRAQHEKFLTHFHELLRLSHSERIKNAPRAQRAHVTQSFELMSEKIRQQSAKK